MRNLLITIAVGGNVLAAVGAYVIYTRPASNEANYSRSDVLSLSYLSAEVTAVNGNDIGKTSLSLNLNLIFPDTEDISLVCRHSRSISRLVSSTFAKYPLQMKTEKRSMRAPSGLTSLKPFENPWDLIIWLMSILV